MDTPSLINTAIQTLYSTFVTYPLAAKIEGCPHCELDEAESALHSKPLRDLTWDDLGVYPFKAMTTFGDIDDFKHFLPRILELYIVDPYSSRYGFETFLWKLKYGEWTDWPEEEQAAILNCIEEWMKELKAEPWDDAYFQSPYEELIEALRENDVAVTI